MKKALLQAIILAVLFAGTWYVLSRVDWLKLFKVERINKETEEKLGDIFWETLNQTEEEAYNKKITAPADSILMRLCSANSIDYKTIKLHILKNDQVNAFAFPGNHMVVYTALLADCKNEAELAGVMAHELAHIQKNHVTKKLMKEVGLATIISITGGNAGGAVIKKLLKTLSSTAYDRGLESEADLTAVDYLIAADIDPAPFADFLTRLADEEPEAMGDLTWISTHPASQERADKIMRLQGQKGHKSVPVLANETWLQMKEKIAE